MQKSKAFTLIEMVIVVAIIAIITVVGLSNLLDLRERQNFEKYIDQIVSELKSLRTESLEFKTYFDPIAEENRNVEYFSIKFTHDTEVPHNTTAQRFVMLKQDDDPDTPEEDLADLLIPLDTIMIHNRFQVTIPNDPFEIRYPTGESVIDYYHNDTELLGNSYNVGIELNEDVERDIMISKFTGTPEVITPEEFVPPNIPVAPPVGGSRTRGGNNGGGIIAR